MNKNTFMYPVRMTAVLAAAALVTSCAKDKFTEANALDLELKRLRTEDSIRVARERQTRIWDNNRLAYNRVLDSLDRINAGGRVFYTVTVVAGGNAAFASGAGRTEELEGVQGATVAIAQYGNIVTQTTPASGMVTVELRSGSANVVVSAPNHTTANYTANLTSDGNDVTNNRLAIAPGNGHTVHVGNVIPLFPTTGAGTATVRGRAYIETNLTNETAEQVTPAVLGAGTNLFTANIDINPAFRTRYLNIGNQSSSIGTVIGAGFEGAINRISYENATTNVVVDATGNYSGVVPATASGLPLQLRYSQIAADRTFWADSFDNNTVGTGQGAVITRRFIYGPGITASNVNGIGPVAPSTVSNATLAFNTQLAPATVTAQITSTGQLLQTAVNGVNYFTFGSDNTFAVGTDTVGIAGAGGNAVDPIGSNGRYLATVSRASLSTSANDILPPAVVFSAPPAGGTQATGEVELSDPDANGYRSILGIRVISRGSGYTANPTVTFVRRDGTFGDGTANVTGTGSLQNPVDRLGSIQVRNGGAGFRNATNPASTPGAWLGNDPTILFNGNATLPPPAVTPAVTFEYDPAGVGTVRRIAVAAPGSGVSAADVSNITFGYGAGANIPVDLSTVPGSQVVLFERDGTGGVQFNFDGTGADVGTVLTSTPYGNNPAAVLTATTFPAAAFTFAVTNLSSGTQPYVFVPTATAVNLPAGAVAPTLAVTVTGTTVSSVTIVGPGSGFGAGAVGDPIQNMAITFSNPTNLLTATGYLAGTGIDNYAFNVAQQNAARIVPTSNVLNSTIGTFNIGNKAQNTYIVRFSAPQAAPFLPAQALPVFDNQRRLIGINITNPGAGYVAGQQITFEVVPNTNSQAAYAGAGYTPIAAGEASGGVPSDDVSAQSVGRLAATLAFTIVDGGRFAAVPDVILSGGGFTLAEQPANTGDLNTITALTTVTNNGLRTATNGRFNFTFNADGVITGITLNGTTPAYTTAPITVQISSARQNEALNRAWNSIPTVEQVVSAGFVGNGRYLTRGIDVNAAGAVTGVTLIDHLRNAANTDFVRQTAIRFFEVAAPTAPAVSAYTLPTSGDYNYIRTVRFITAPTLTFGSTAAGTGATGTAVLAQNIGTLGGAFQGVTVTAGGSGYLTNVAGYIRNGRIVGTYSGNATTGFFRNFSILAPTDGSSGDNLTAIDAFSGVTYVRDVHYGTGAYFQVGEGR